MQQTQINEQIKKNFNNRHAIGTSTNYNGTIGHWTIYCELQQKPKKDFSEWNIRQFLAWKQIINGIGWSAMHGHKYAIRDHAKTLGFNIDVSAKGMPKLYDDIIGEKRRKPSGPGSKPVDRTMIKRFYRINRDDPSMNERDTLIWEAILALGHDAIKRGSEITYDDVLEQGIELNKFEFQIPFDGNALDCKQWTKSKYCTYNRNKGKTYQFGAKLTAVLICNCFSKVCALHALIKLIEYKINNRDSDLNRIFQLTNGKSLNKYALAQGFRKLTKACGFQPGEVTPHGARKGGAQQAIRDGLPAPYIMKQADWRTEKSLNRYNSNVQDEKRIDMFVKMAKKAKKRHKKSKKRRKNML